MPPTAIVRMICAAVRTIGASRRFTDLSRDEVSDALQIRMDAASALIVIGHLIGSSETQGAGIVDETPMPPAATFPMVDLH